MREKGVDKRHAGSGRIGSDWGSRLLLALILCLVGPASSWAKTLVVAMDDNYPPYVFRDAEQHLQGILPEMWSLWSRKTGMEVRVEAMDWAQAKNRFNEGEAEVIDTIFRTPERDRIYEFSAPYATIQVSIYFAADLSGIRDARTLRGFTVGVKDGDACIDYLSSRGITSFHRYPSYESLIEAAGKGDVKTMCADQPPAVYFLVKAGLQDKFRATEPLYSGAFHWAVLKGHETLRATIENGFRQISEQERRAIEDRWLGHKVAGGMSPETLRQLGTAGLAIVAVAAFLLAWVWILRRQVAAKTLDLSRIMADLAIGETRFRTIFNNINDAIFIHDADSGTILQSNRRAEEMYGWKTADFPNLSIAAMSEGKPPFDQAHAMEWIRRSANEPQVFEWRARRRDGTLFWAEVALRRAALERRRESVLVVVRDISERKESEERLNRTIEALTRSNTDLESFAYAASHDLREPLTTVVRYAQFLESRHRGSLDEGGAEALDFIQKGVRQMMRLVEGLLDYARVESGDRRLTTVDAGAVVAEVREALKAPIAEAEAEIRVGALPPLVGDPLQMTQLFQNLIANAVKYRAPERRLVVSISGRLLPNGDSEIRVADNGIGIDPAYRDQVFVIFKRLHTQEAIPGGGIGLALCKRIVERHSGRIRIEDTPGGGTTFVFTIGARLAI
jgi:PAS domain S-box-containing protein